MVKRNFLIFILLFFLKIFTIKCDDNKCFVEFKFAGWDIECKESNDTKKDIELKKVKLDDIKNKPTALQLFNDLKRSNFFNEGNGTTDDKNICDNNPDFLGVVIYKKVEIRDKCYHYEYIDLRNPGPDCEITSFDDLKKKINSNPVDYKDTCIVFYFERKGYIENIKKYEKEIKVVGIETTTWGGNGTEKEICKISKTDKIKTQIQDDLSTKDNHEFIQLKALIDEEKEINNKLNNTKEFDNVELDVKDNNKCLPKTIREIKELGGSFETKFNTFGKIYKINVSFKRNFTITIKPPTNYKVVSIFEKPFDLKNIKFKDFNLSTIIHEIASEMSKTVCDKNKDLKKEGGDVDGYDLEHIFDIDRNNDEWYEYIGYDSKELNITYTDEDSNIITKKITNDNDLKKECIFLKKNGIVKIEFVVGEFSQLLKSVFIQINIEPTDDYVLCDRVPKKLVIPLNIEEVTKLKDNPDFNEKFENLIKEEFIKFLRRQGIKSETIGENNLKIPKELFDLLKKDLYGKITNVEGMNDCEKVIIKFNDNAVGRFCKKEGEADPATFDPDTDEKYKDNPNEPIVTINHKKDDIPDQKLTKELGCCAKCMKCCCCCKNNDKRKRSNSI